MASEQELLSQLEELRKKQKEMEEENKDAEFNKQRNFLIKIIRDFLEIEVSDEEVLAILYKYFGSQYSSRTHPNGEVKYYLKKEDENMLFERKVSNRYARYHEIRVDDSDMIIHNFIDKIQPLNDYNEWKIKMHNQGYSSRRRSNTPICEKGHEKIFDEYIPLFC
jgi:hypothetical protein